MSLTLMYKENGVINLEPYEQAPLYLIQSIRSNSVICTHIFTNSITLLQIESLCQWRILLPENYICYSQILLLSAASLYLPVTHNPWSGIAFLKESFSCHIDMSSTMQTVLWIDSEEVLPFFPILLLIHLLRYCYFLSLFLIEAQK